MRRVLAFLLLACTLSGCSASRETPALEQTESTPSYETEAPAPEVSTAPAWEKYEAQYHIHSVFEDFFTPGKYLIIGEEKVLLLISLGGIEELTVLRLQDVERVEQTNLPEFVTVKIYDKTNTELSIVVTPEDGNTIAQMLG